MTRVVFRRAAEIELQDASAWYEERESGLGGKFVECVDACVQTIRRHPEIFPVTQLDFTAYPDNRVFSPDRGGRTQPGA